MDKTFDLFVELGASDEQVRHTRYYALIDKYIDIDVYIYVNI